MNEEDVRWAGITPGQLAYLMGFSIACAVSWATHKSILWAILHGLASWGYVIYFAIWGR